MNINGLAGLCKCKENWEGALKEYDRVLEITGKLEKYGFKIDEYQLMHAHYHRVYCLERTLDDLEKQVIRSDSLKLKHLMYTSCIT